MAVAIKEIQAGRQAGVSEDFESTYTRRFRAKTDDAHVGPVAVKAALNLRIGQAYSIGVAGTDPWHEEDLGAILKSVDLACTSDDGREWEITAQYGPWSERPRAE